MNQDEKYMREAIRQAKKAYALEEVPIGCVIVYQDKIIGRGYNRRTVDKNTLAHAELQAIRKASKKMDDWRLEDCTMYVTLEPCQMCSGAIVQARIKRVVVGCMNPKAGCAGSILNLLDMKEFNHQVELMRLMGALRGQGKTVVAVLHDLNQASRYCDHLVVMANGHVMAQGTPEAVMNPGLLRSVFSVETEIHPEPISGRPMCVIM